MVFMNILSKRTTQKNKYMEMHLWSTLKFLDI